MVEKNTEIKGVDDFIAASDEFYKYLASVLREEIQKNSKDIERLRELSELVKINSASIKTQREESKGKTETPVEKTKRKAGGGQVVV